MVITETDNPPRAAVAPYFAAVIIIAVAAIGGVVAVIVLRPSQDNANLVTQILGFAATTLMGTLAYMRSTETREVVNSRMDEFKRALQATADAAVLQAHAEGKAEGRESADARTDSLAAKTEHDRVK